MRTPRWTDERGVALPLALFALLVIGALVTAPFFLGRLEQQAGRNTMLATQAAAAADAGLAETMETDPAVLAEMEIYDGDPADELQFSGSLPGQATAQYATTVRRLNQSLFLVTAAGERLQGGTVAATSSVGAFLRIFQPTFDANGAITISDQLNANGNAFEVSGMNETPDGWTNAYCGADSTRTDNTDDRVGVRTAGEHGLTSNELDNIEGFPLNTIENDTTVTSATFQDYVDYNYNTMKDAADKTIPDGTNITSDAEPVVVSGECDEDADHNFGEPLRGAGSVPECYGYFPVTHVAGTVKFAGDGRGQGTLLVDGDLEVNGTFEWAGIIIVRGQFKITGTGGGTAKITGALLAEGVTNTLGGNISVQYSRCAIAKAVLGAAATQPLTQRSWAQLN